MTQSYKSSSFATVNELNIPSVTQLIDKDKVAPWQVSGALVCDTPSLPPVPWHNISLLSPFLDALASPGFLSVSRSVTHSFSKVIKSSALWRLCKFYLEFFRICGLQFCKCASFTAVRKFHRRVAHLSSLGACFIEALSVEVDIAFNKVIGALSSFNLKCYMVGLLL